MKAHWLIPLTCDAAFQFTSRNEIARAFCALGNEITTVVAYINERMPMDGFNAVEYIRVPSGSLLRRLYFHWRMLKSTWTSGADVIIFGHQTSHLIPLAWLAGLFHFRTRLVMDIRTIPVDVKPGLEGKVRIWQYLLSLRLADIFCDGITFITPMLRDSVLPKLKRLKNKMGVWTSGVNLDHFDRTGSNRRRELGLKGRRVLIYHGVLSPSRGLQNAIRAVRILKSEFPDILFLIVGDGTGRRELENLTKDVKLTENVRFVGKVPYSEVSAYVRSADLAILPFPAIQWWSVSSPLKLMEYLAAGIPVVATDIDAHHIVADQTGGIVLAKDGSPESLAQGISHAFRSKVLKPVDLNKLQHTISWTKQADELSSFLKKIQVKSNSLQTMV